MKIKTSLQIGALFPIGLAIVVSLGMFFRAMAVQRARQAENVEVRTAGTEETADIYFMVFVGVMGLLMAASIMSIGRTITGRLGRIEDVARRVADGDFSQRLDARGDDEISTLSGVFNTMVQQLQQSYQAIQNESSALRQETMERSKAAAAAREANVRLADALNRLKRAQVEVVQKERARAREQIEGGIARELNAALSPILSSVDLLLAQPENLARREDLLPKLQAIRAASHDIRKVVLRVSEVFTAPEKIERQKVDLEEVIDKAVRMTEQHWTLAPPERRTKLFRQASRKGLHVAGMQAELVEAVAHLITNAVEAMPSGGTIQIETHEEDSFAVLTITDTGEGMTADVRQRCLEPFFSTRGQGHSGMGLPFVLTAAERFGGSLEIRSEEQKGTVIVVRLPFYDAAPAAEERAEPAAPVPANLRVLIIDDEQWVCNLVTKTLTAQGHTVEAASNAKAGIEKCMRSKFDVVILDWAMPDMNGDQVSTEIKKQRPNLPIVLMTGLGDVMKEKAQHMKNVDVVLTKPATLKEINRAIAEAVGANPPA